MYDTIIIGAGMSGLAAGIRLAYYDQRVCILERHYTIGGLNSFYRLRGRDYDVGLHALTNFTPKGTKTGPLARLLRQLRLRWDDFAHRAAARLGDRLSRRAAAVRQRRRTLRDEVAWAFPAAGRQLRPAAARDRRLRRPQRDARQPLGPRGRRLDHHASRCWWRCCSAR